MISFTKKAHKKLGSLCYVPGYPELTRMDAATFCKKPDSASGKIFIVKVLVGGGGQGGKLFSVNSKMWGRQHWKQKFNQTIVALLYSLTIIENSSDTALIYYRKTFSFS